jgi:hypothetical protein
LAYVVIVKLKYFRWLPNSLLDRSKLSLFNIVNNINNIKFYDGKYLIARVQLRQGGDSNGLSRIGI